MSSGMPIVVPQPLASVQASSRGPARLLKTLYIGFFGLVLSSGALAQPVSINDEFAPDFNGPVRTVEVDQRGKLLFGGSFTQVNGQSAMRLARLLGHGGLDPDFNTVIPAGVIRVIAPTSDDRLLIGGSLNSVNGQAFSNLALLENDGSNVVSFAPQFDDQVRALALVDDANLYFAGGSFTQVNGLNRSRVALMTNGNVLPNFVPTNLTGTALALARQRDGKVLVTGSIRRIGAPGTQGPVLRLNPNGSVDTSFFFAASGAADEGYTLVVLPDQRILLGGNFTSQDGTKFYLRRLNLDGTRDASFVPPPLNGTVRDLSVQADGRIVIVGDFTGVTLRNRIARLNGDGSLDASYGALLDPNASVSAVALQRHEGAVFGGVFSAISGQARLGAARIGYRGQFDTRFTAQVSGGAVEVMAAQPDGRVLLGGGFTSVGGQLKPFLARVNLSGNLDTTFTATPNNEVRAIAVLADRSVLIAGAFNAINGAARLRIAKLSATGALDPAFNVAVNGGTIHTLTLQADGKILIGGSFLSIGATPRVGIARLHADGTLDGDFVPAPLSTFTRVRAIAVSTDDTFMSVPGRIFLGGETSGENRLERLFTNGSLDATFRRINSGDIWSISTLGFGQVLYGGFTGSGSCGRFLRTDQTGQGTCVANLNAPAISFLPTVRGDYFVGGAFTEIANISATGLAQITRHGQVTGLSEQFVMAVSGDAATVNSLVLQDDGKLLFAGAFTAVNGQARERMARSGEAFAEFLPFDAATRVAGIKTLWDFSTREARFVPGGLDIQLERAPILLSAAVCCDAAAFTPVAGPRSVRDSLEAHVWLKANVPATSAPFFLRWRYSNRDGRGGTSLYESPILRVVPRSPTLSFSPAPSRAANTVVFPSGPVGAGLRQITVTPSGTEGGTTRLDSCAIDSTLGATNFEIVRAVPANFTWERTNGLIELRCTRTAQASTASLSCGQVASDGTALAPVAWGLTCPAASGPQDLIFANGFE